MDPLNLTSGVIDNTLAALIGAFIISAMGWGYKRLRNTMNERKYSIKGEYRATYEEVVDGKTTYEKSIVKIRQKGLKIIADDYDEAMQKDWTLTGEIDPVTGRVYGYYKTKAHVETGLGVCIFEQKANGTLDGLWAGYDTNIEDIEHGRYTLVKRLDINVRKASKADTMTIVNLLDQELGEGWLTVKDIHKAIDDALLFVATHNKKIVGFTLLRMLKTGDFEKELKGHTYNIPRDLQHANACETIGFIEAIATDPAYQKRGIGTKLVEKSTTVLQKNGAEIITAIGWKTKTVHIEPTLIAQGFKQRVEFKEFWLEESKQEPYDCPECGAPPCYCGAVLFSKAV
jgi:ribosomal protein S18 acetylase RimI-like enzyme